MWLMINLAPGAQTVTDFYFHYIRVTLLRIAIGNEKGFFFYHSRHVRSRHIVYGQDTWYMDIFYQATVDGRCWRSIHMDNLISKS